MLAGEVVALRAHACAPSRSATAREPRVRAARGTAWTQRRLLQPLTAVVGSGSTQETFADAATVTRGGGDAGDWSRSPEWWGTQDGGWGRSAGRVVFEERSEHGNGLVLVTAHDAGAWDRAEDARKPAPAEEWRVLRFNGRTRQSVALVQPGLPARAAPDVLAFEYTKTLGALALALLRPLRPRPLRVLCVGLGGGSLPLWLAHHLPSDAHVLAAELDPAVERAAAHMGFHAAAPERVRVHLGDAAQLAAAEARGGGAPFDLCIIDAFDGDDRVPAQLAGGAAGAPFRAALAALLHPTGALLMNMHGGAPPPPLPLSLLAAAAGGRFAPRGFDEASAAGAAVAATAAAYAEALLPHGAGGGGAITVSVASQDNVILAVSRSADHQRDMAAALERVAVEIDQARGRRDSREPPPPAFELACRVRRGAAAVRR